MALILILSLTSACAAVPAVTQACTIDGQPSAVADGHRAVPAPGNLTAASVRTWAPFAFPGAYHVHTVIRLREERAQLRAVLPPEAFTRPWLWQFGDGTRAVGWTVRHRYSRPGSYRIVVAAYFPTWHRYVAVDAVRIVMTP
jgi:hypothetical protein